MDVGVYRFASSKVFIYNILLHYERESDPMPVSSRCESGAVSCHYNPFRVQISLIKSLPLSSVSNKNVLLTGSVVREHIQRLSNEQSANDTVIAHIGTWRIRYIFVRCFATSP
jgi:hypothetical protein